MAQWNKKTQDFLDQERSLFEVYNIADHWGNQTDWRPQFTNNNRLKVAPYQTVFFNTFQYGKETDVWDERIVGIATATFNVNASNVIMQVGSTTGSKIIRQTKNVMRYIPGRGATLAFAIRLDGAGIVEFAWLMKNETVVSHTFENSNTNPGVWCSTPFLPIRLEIENVTGVAGTHYLYQGSNSLIQEGEPEKLGALESISNPITGTTMPLANTFYPIISLRLKSSNLGAVMLLRSLQAATDDNANVYWELIENATNTGGTWVDHPDPNSFMQYNITETATTGGNTLLSGFVINGNGTLVDLDDKAALQLGRSGIGTISDTYTLACASPSTNKKALAVLNWIEQR